MAKTEVEEVLGEPINPELSEYAQKLRRNLLAFGAIYLFCWFNGVQISRDSTFFGIQLVGVNEQQFSAGTMLINAYLLVHFGWYAWEAILEWRVRITGTRNAYQTNSTNGGLPSAVDKSYDPRQSTLYNWWLRLARNIGHRNNVIDDFDQRLKQVERELKALDPKSVNVNVKDLVASLAQLPDGLGQIRSYMERIDRALSSGRIEEALGRFDQWFKLMLRSQNMRMILIDISLPLFIGIAATGLNVFSLFCQ
jgi:hypothetical protein